MKKHNTENKLRKPECILFDTDNTLYEYEPANNAALEAVCLKATNLLGINRKTFSEFYSLGRNEVKSLLKNTASGHSRLLYFQRMLELLGLKSQLLLALDFEQTFWRTFLANAPLFPGVNEILNLLNKKQIPIGIITDLTSHIQLRKLTYFGLEDSFDAVVTSEEIGADKPDKRNFILILKKLNLKKNAYFWMIGDNPIADIMGAKKLGGITFQKIHDGVKLGKKECMPDYSFSNYADLIELLNNL